MRISCLKKYFTYSDDSGNRANNFNIIRIIAAAMVIYGHMSFIMGVPVQVLFGQAISSVGVKVLFVISGYLIMKSFDNDSNFGRYMIRRSFRIFPGLIGVVLFAMFIIGPVFTSMPLKEYFSAPDTWQYLKNIILSPVYYLPGVFANYTYPNAVNGSLWTMPLEFCLYLVLPLVAVVFKKLKILKPGMILVVLICVFANIYKTINPEISFVFYGTDWTQAFVLIPYFFAGSFLALKGAEKLLNLQVAVIMMALLLVLKLSAVKYELLLCFILPYAVISFSLAEKPVFLHWFEKSDFSYGIYLYGFVVQQVVYHQLEKLNNSIFSLNVSFLICFAVTFVCAVISFYLIEKPFQVLSKKIIKSLRK